jgi:nucleotide-binding universal stress UspA family protein
MAPTRIEIDRILCPVDFSELSGPALERAVRLGNWFDARVEVLHVISFVPCVMPGSMGPFHCPDPLEVTLTKRRQAARSIADLVAPFLDDRVPIATKVLEGDPSRMIQEEAEALPADLLVIGTHGRSGFEQLLRGSVTEKEMRRAPCPVLTVGHVSPHPPRGPLFRRILCASDLTQASEQTLDMAFFLATENGAQITLLHVIDTPPGDTWAGFRVALPEVGPLRHEFVAKARAELLKTVPDSARNLCEVTERVETGAPWSEILRVAHQMDADLIVMGAHSRGAMGRMFLGSTASKVVRRATCPVLLNRDPRSGRPSLEAAEAVGWGPRPT